MASAGVVFLQEAPNAITSISRQYVAVFFIQFTDVKMMFLRQFLRFVRFWLSLQLHPKSKLPLTNRTISMKKNHTFKALTGKITLLLIITAFTLNAQTKKEPVDSKKPAAQKEQMVSITTEYGVIKIKLYNETPKHRDNFIKLTKEGFFDSTLFHRVIPNFMIQGGDPQSKNAAPGQMLGSGDVGYRIPAEFVDALYHKRGALEAISGLPSLAAANAPRLW